MISGFTPGRTRCAACSTILRSESAKVLAGSWVCAELNPCVARTRKLVADLKEATSTVWFVYIVKCPDGSLYTGITNDLNRRLTAHNAGDGAKYLRPKCKRPVTLVFLRSEPNKSRALIVEAYIKKQPRRVKQEIIDEYQLWCKQWGVPSIYASKRERLLARDGSELDDEQPQHHDD